MREEDGRRKGDDFSHAQVERLLSERRILERARKIFLKKEKPLHTALTKKDTIR